MKKSTQHEFDSVRKRVISLLMFIAAAAKMRFIIITDLFNTYINEIISENRGEIGEVISRSIGVMKQRILIIIVVTDL